MLNVIVSRWIVKPILRDQGEKITYIYLFSMVGILKIRMSCILFWRQYQS